MKTSLQIFFCFFLSPAEERRIIIMLLTVSFAYLLLTTPFYVRGVAFYVWDTHAVLLSNPSLFVYIESFNSVTALLYFTNFAINFYLYVLSGTKFRQDLIKICCCVPCRHDAASTRGGRKPGTKLKPATLHNIASPDSSAKTRSSTNMNSQGGIQ